MLLLLAFCRSVVCVTVLKTVIILIAGHDPLRSLSVPLSAKERGRSEEHPIWHASRLGRVLTTRVKLPQGEPRWQGGILQLGLKVAGS